ncbi:MAG: hypothetical protein ORN53_00420 [Crocinitomicaceae bacterium]|nr:hypothetical protein [Crocinitomicaceae bacterium]
MLLKKNSHPINLHFLSLTDTDRLIELFTDTPDEVFDLRNGSEKSSISWEIEAAFCKHFHLKWRDKVLHGWISRKALFGSPMLLFYCAEVRSKEWWASFPEGSLPNDGGRSYKIHEGKTDAVVQTSSCKLELSGDMHHIRLREICEEKML